MLWVLSEQVVFDIGGRSLAIPGYMVWCALAYSLGGSLLAWRVGRPLVALNAERYAREADLRFALVRVNEYAAGISLYGGEADERRVLDEPVDRVVTVMARLAGGLARLTWITSGYGWLAIVVPIIVAAPGYFDGELSFGDADDGGRRVQPGAVVAALVRRQSGADRRLAGDPRCASSPFATPCRRSTRSARRPAASRSSTPGPTSSCSRAWPSRSRTPARRSIRTGSR